MLFTMFSSLRMTVNIYRLQVLRKHCSKKTCFLYLHANGTPFSPSNNILFSVLGNAGLHHYMKYQIKSCICQFLPKELKCFYLASFKSQIIKSLLLQIFITFLMSLLQKHPGYIRGEGPD